MSSTQYTAIEASEECANTREDVEIFTPVDPYITRPGFTYLQYFIPLLAIFAFPLIFTTYILVKGRLLAPPWLSNFAESNPRVTSQIVAILATSLTATARWALGGAAALLARKRLLRPRPVYEIDMFFSLRNISVIWDWKHRRRMMFLTWFLVALCGLLTSGFFTLLNPLPMQDDIQLPSAQEINLAADSDNWVQWYNEAGRGNFSQGTLGTQRLSASMTDVPAFLESVTRQYIASKYQSKSYPPGSLVTSYMQLGYTSFKGSTAGALISGMGDNGGRGALITPLGRPQNRSYSLNLQGIWIDVSCRLGAPLVNATATNTTNGVYRGYNFTCPGLSRTKTIEFMPASGKILAFDCPTDLGATEVRFLSPSSWHGFQNESTFKIVDEVACNLSPRIGDVTAVLDRNLGAFTMSKRHSTAISSLPPIARNITGIIINNVMHHFENTPLAIHTFEALTLVKGDKSAAEAMVLELIALILSTVFELEASFARLVATGSLTELQGSDPPSSEIPREFAREVTVVLHDDAVGWAVKGTTLLGLVPLVAVCIISFTMIGMAFWTEGELTLFDPMSPVSLLAATSVGKVSLPNRPSYKTIGGPLDENVLITRISYTQKDETWGLWSSEGGVKEPA